MVQRVKSGAWLLKRPPRKDGEHNPPQIDLIPLRFFAMPICLLRLFLGLAAFAWGISVVGN